MISIINIINNFFNKIIQIGVSDDTDDSNNNTIVLNNLNWIYFTIIIALFGVLGTYYNIKNSGISCLIFILVYSSVLITSYLKKINLSKNINLLLLTSFVLISSLIYGIKSNLIFFYFPILIMVFFLYTVKDYLYIGFYFILIAVIFLVYNYGSEFLSKYAILSHEAHLVNKFIVPFQIFNLFLILYFGFKRNNDNENKIVFQKRYFENILNTIPIEIVVMDDKFNYQFVNKKAIIDDEIRNWIIGKSDYEYVTHRNKNIEIADSRQEMYKMVEKEGFANIDEIFILPNNKKRYTNKTMLKLDHNELSANVSYIGFSLDMTNKREAEELLKEYMIKLEKSNEEIKQFAYVTSHDLKSPLRNISSLLQLTKKKNENIINSDSKELLDICIKSANSLYTIVNDVLLYTTSEVDSATYSIINVNEVVYDVLNNINSFVDENNASVTVKSVLPQVYSHKTMIFNLFLNLIQNGIKYNKSEIPKVDIDYTEDDKNFIFSISDNGIGIDEKYKEQIFVVFKRLHTQQEYEGTGIGLSICKKIVENLNGKIWLESSIGNGSTFFISLPKA